MCDLSKRSMFMNFVSTNATAAPAKENKISVGFTYAHKLGLLNVNAQIIEL